MYIPSLFSTSPNGCPSGFNAYKMAGIGTSNLNTGARGRITVNANLFTTDVVGENYQGLGNYVSNVVLNNGASYQTQGIVLPTGVFNDQLNFWGSSGQNQSIDYYMTSSAGEQLYYCYDCTRRWRYTIGSQACQAAPWPQFATPLTLAVLSSPTGSSYTLGTFNFCAGITSSIEGFGPIWGNGSSNNQASYYIISRTDITPRYYNIQNCLTSSITASISVGDNASETKLTTGNVYLFNGTGLTGSCWEVTNTFTSGTFTPNYSNVVSSSTFTNCTDCLDFIFDKFKVVNCSTSQSYVMTFSGSIPQTGSVIRTNVSGIANECLLVAELTSSFLPVDYNNVVTASSYSNCTDCNNSKLVEFLIVAGGGGGGSVAGGGGGAGGYISSSIFITASSYSVTIGNGGNGGNDGTNGGNSSIFSIAANGGGRGGSGTTSDSGSVGGSGGGAGANVGGFCGNGAQNSGSILFPNQGNRGGCGQTPSGQLRAGGGGGASTVGGPGFESSQGGDGKAWLDGNIYAGGGGGKWESAEICNGGIGGGGCGQTGGGISATSGTPNTGGGGGGGNGSVGNGGSGIVKLRYNSGSIMNATGGTITVSGSYVYHSFTTSGTFSF